MPPKHEQQSGSHPVGDQPPKTPDTPAKEEGEPKLLAGKYKTMEDFEAGHTDLENRFGTQTVEVGELRNQIGNLTGKLLNVIDRVGAPEGGQPETPQGDTQADIDAEFAEVQKKVEAGDMSTGEALAETRRITTREAMAQAQETVLEMNAHRDAETATQNFLKKYPDYEEVANSGALDDILAEDPTADTVTAYHANRARLAMADREQAIKEAYDKGKDEQAKAEEGVRGTQTVLDQPGTEIARTNKTGPLTDSQMEDSMMGSISKLRVNQ